jgi:DNA-binding MarR family transcriptional regulator
MLEGVPTSDADRRRLSNEITELLRDVATELDRVTAAVAGRAGVDPMGMRCLDVLFRRGPAGPNTLARLLDVHPATMTGILDRLQAAGLVRRQADSGDRRRVVVELAPMEARAAVANFKPMVTRLERIMSTRSAEQLQMIAGFLDEIRAAGHDAAGEIAGEGGEPPG